MHTPHNRIRPPNGITSFLSRLLKVTGKLLGLAAAFLFCSHTVHGSTTVNDSNTVHDSNAVHESNATPLSPTATPPSVRLDTAHPVLDLAYGDFLFDYYQERYFTSITKALIAQKRGQLNHHDPQVQVLLGTLYVNYGLLNQAESIFNNLLEHAIAEKTRLQIWYHLANVYYKRGNHEKAINILKERFVNPESDLANQVALLLALNLIATEQLEEATTQLESITSKVGFSAFAKFNLASAKLQLGKPDEAIELYNEVLWSYSDPRDKVASALKDKAVLALGTTHLKNEDWRKARKTFEAMQFDSASANTALLGLGWSYLNAEDYVGALAPWQELSKRDPSHLAVHEVMHNLPFVYEKAGALQDALDGYRVANQYYNNTLQNLDDIQQVIDQNSWIESLTPILPFSDNPLDNVGKFTPPQGELSHYMIHFYASHEFQENFRNLKELIRLKQLLYHWQKDLPIFNQMIDTNVKRLDQLSPKAEKMVKDAELFLASSTEMVKDFTRRLNKARDEDDITITANDSQTELLGRLEKLGEKLERLPKVPGYDVERERYRVVKGLLLWDLNDSAIERRWERTKDKVFIEGQLEVLEKRIQLVISARERRTERFTGFTSRINELDERLSTLQVRSRRVILLQQAYLKKIAKGIIGYHQQHVRNLQANTTYSIARLQDMAYIQSQKAAASNNEIPGETPSTPSPIEESQAE